MSRRWLLPAILIVLLFAASLIHVEPGTLGVLKGAADGKSFVLEPGLHFRIPFLQRLMVFPSGTFRLEFEQDALSREGSRVRLRVRFDGLLLRDRLADFARKAGARNGPTVVQDELKILVAHYAAGRSAADIPSDPREVGELFLGAARAGGYQIKTLTLQRLPGPGEAASPPPPAPGNRVKVVLVGIDAADWQILDPLIAAGKAPAFARLKRQGAWADLHSMDPMLSPLLWTTVATGRPPEEHGVVDFLVRGAGGRAPVSSAQRKVRALWNIFSAAGETCDIVAWWATWPAERIKGTLVSDRVAYSLFDSAGGAPLQGAVYPESYAATVGRLQVTADRITLKDLLPFVDIRQSDLDAARRRAAAHPGSSSRDPLIHLTRILAGARTYHAVAMDLLSRGQPDLFLVYYEAIDEVSHRFAQFADPKMDMVSEADHRRYRKAVEAMYVEQDRMLGEILSRVDPASLVLVVSDHGFRNGAGRPRDKPPDIEGQPARWHRPYGIFLARGPMIVPGRKDTLSLLDIAPIVLEAGGLPAAANMPGKVPANLFTQSFAASRPQERIATYETGRPPGPGEGAAPDDEAARRAAAALEENLRSLGYIGAGSSRAGKADGEGGSGTAFSHANLAGIYLAKGKLEAAEREAKRSLEIAPGYLPALVYLAEVYQQQKRFAEALPLARQAADTDSPDRQSGIYLLIANLYVSLGKEKEGLTDLSGALPRHGDESDLHSALGILRGASGDRAGAEKEYLRALALDPMAQEPVKRLFDLEEPRGDLEKLEPVLQEALARNGDSAFHHTWLGLVYDHTGKLAEAEQEYRSALKSDPDNVEALVNLGGLLARQRKLEKAEPPLRRALEIDPHSLEARVGLGAVLGIQGRTREAIDVLEAGRALGLASPSLCNALAMAYHQNRDREKALAALKESLRLDPGQRSARAMLEEWEKP